MLRLLAGGGEGCRTSGGLCARFDAYQDTGTDSGAGWPAGCAFRWMLAQLLAKLDRLEEERACVDARIDVLATEYKDRLQRLSTIPGVDRTTALVLLAECGEDMACRSSRRQLIWPVGPGCVRAMPKVPENASRPHAQRRPVCASHPGAECLGCFALPRLFSRCRILPHCAAAWAKEGCGGCGPSHRRHCLAHSGRGGCRVSRARWRFLRPAQSRAHRPQTFTPVEISAIRPPSSHPKSPNHSRSLGPLGPASTFRTVHAAPAGAPPRCICLVKRKHHGHTSASAT